MNLHPVTAFFRHLLTGRSAAGHGVHSPFVFDFLTEVVMGKSDPHIMGEVEMLRREMLADRRTVRVTDLGAGSAVHKGEERRISDIASAAALPARQAALLSRIAGYMSDMSLRAASPVRRTGEPDRERDPTDVSLRATSPVRRTGEPDRERDPTDVSLRAASPVGRTGEPDRERDPTDVSLRATSPVGPTGEPDRERDPTDVSLQATSPVRRTGEPDSQRATRVEAPQTKKPWIQLPDYESVSQAHKHNAEDTARRPSSRNQGIILELGTSLGITTLAMALAAPERRVVTIEGCPALAAIARENLLRHGAANAEVLNMEFSAALHRLKREGTEVSLAFIDGNHRGGALKQYARSIRAMGEEMIIVADDIHMNRDMYSAWCSLAEPDSSRAATGRKSFRSGVSSEAPPAIAQVPSVPGPPGPPAPSAPPAKAQVPAIPGPSGPPAPSAPPAMVHGPAIPGPSGPPSPALCTPPPPPLPPPSPPPPPSPLRQ
ncbi:MAG: class I SAM-dependent methyltransferase [Bacteroidales bacterium]|nr:class I SAM-dependent methyltransferase [Bacteroidales bacterium]